MCVVFVAFYTFSHRLLWYKLPIVVALLYFQSKNYL